MEKRMEDEKVLSYGDVVLRRSDLGILSGPHFLNDRIIEFYFSYLSSDLSAEDVLLVPPSISQWIKECPGSIEDFVKPLNFRQKKLILFPVNDNTDVSLAEGGCHWSLLAYLRSGKVFVHHDSSSGSMNAIQARRLLSRVQPYTVYDASFVECPSVPKQTNGYDCGLYVCAFARAICNWFKEVSEENVDKKKLWFDDLATITPSSVSQMRGEIHDLIKSLMEPPAMRRPDPFEELIADGSYFPTITLTVENCLWPFRGQVHPSHYVHEDIVEIAFLSDSQGNTPFVSVGLTCDFVGDPAVVDALAAVAPESHNSAQARGFYVIGRGVKHYYQCFLALVFHRMNYSKCFDIVSYRENNAQRSFFQISMSILLG
ncbi:OLC1v1004045C1 [Oldenlandia corymbosa var. corymbosa]|uniref:OLC1v1004045C1 n=1 Tax=Oldenlandia corymbosa var. corymbosa TaxID=529605 RepID=A0AAV1DCM3_OLDCO|nr:OLC1v1004045C1 [Oldenlandia corymbosa var. corymbosa]